MKYLVYFLIGGITVSAVTYLASNSRGLAAAFVANLPIITMITFLTINAESGQEAVLSYAKGLLVMLAPWLAYIFTVILLTPRISLVPSLIAGVSLYLLLAALFVRAGK